MEDKHTLLVGDSGSGKTTLLHEVIENQDCLVLINDHNEKDLPGRVVHGNSEDSLYESFYESLIDSESWEDITVRLRSDSLAAREIQSVCKRISVDLWDTGYIPNAVVTDEVHNVMPDKSEEVSENVTRWLLHEGRGYGIKFIGTEQTPSTLPSEPLLQVNYWAWVGPPAGSHNSFLSHNKWSWIPKEKFRGENFKYLVFDKRGVILWFGETKEKYASETR